MSVMSVMSVVNSPNLFVESGVIPCDPHSPMGFSGSWPSFSHDPIDWNDLKTIWTDFGQILDMSRQGRVDWGTGKLLRTCCMRSLCLLRLLRMVWILCIGGIGSTVMFDLTRDIHFDKLYCCFDFNHLLCSFDICLCGEPAQSSLF